MNLRRIVKRGVGFCGANFSLSMSKNLYYYHSHLLRVIERMGLKGFSGRSKVCCANSVDEGFGISS